MGGNFGFEMLERLLKILHAYLNNLLFSGNWNLLWFIFFFLIIYNWRKISFSVKWFCLAVGLFFFAYALLGMATQSFEYIGGKYGEHGLSRLILHFFPLIIPAIIFAYDDTKKAA